ncbi:MAG: class I SAM-dependent methyltransferase [Gammaproteobacteria bacterium]
MKTEWDYTSLADAYLKRPDYADQAIDLMLSTSGISHSKDAKICDIGAGVGHLTIMLAKRGYQVHAVEPNDAMRQNGCRQTQNMSNVSWFEGTGENTGMEAAQFSLATFGSSFNVVDRAKALAEVKRITKPNAWFACMWNHRNIDDPIQQAVEEIIAAHIPGYNYGTRRENQSEFLEKSGYFDNVDVIEEQIQHKVSIQDWIEAWRSHATLHRQAGDKFTKIIQEIEQYLHKTISDMIPIPYTTRIWLAQFNR